MEKIKIGYNGKTITYYLGESKSFTKQYHIISFTYKNLDVKYNVDVESLGYDFNSIVLNLCEVIDVIGINKNKYDEFRKFLYDYETIERKHNILNDKVYGKEKDTGIEIYLENSTKKYIKAKKYFEDNKLMEFVKQILD